MARITVTSADFLGRPTCRWLNRDAARVLTQAAASAARTGLPGATVTFAAAGHVLFHAQTSVAT